ncbi:MAG: type II secretion system protein GspJ [Chthoniobacteraceae bacterium]
MNRRAFTLIEILLATFAAAILLLGLYGIFQRAIKTRDSATERLRESRLRERAVAVIRNDLFSAYISGGVLACTLEGGAGNQKSHFGGYLRFTATTGEDDNDDQGYGDVQQIEYYISGNGNSANNGPLVRVLTRDLLGSGTENSEEIPVLQRVEKFEVAFWDGSSWQDTWQLSGSSSSSSLTSTSLTADTSGSNSSTSGTSSLPRAVRVRLIQSPVSNRVPVPPPIEIFVPFTTEPFTTSTTSTTSGT